MDVKILYRHPDAAVRKLPPKVLELHDKKEDTLIPFMPQNVNGNWIYTVPLRFAQRLLAHQPDRYFLLEPSELTVRTPGDKFGTFKWTTVKSRGDLLSKLEKTEPVAGDAEAKAKAEADAKAAAEAETQRQAAAKAKADQEALDVLQNASLPEAGSARPPEL